MNFRNAILSLILSISAALSAQPQAPVRMCAEWEPAVGSLIRWPLGIPLSLVIELAEDDSLYVLVENQEEEQAAVSVFSTIGANTEQISFIYTDTYSHWTRDWGPVSIFDGNGTWNIVDPLFDGYPWVPGGRDWSEDDAVNIQIAEYFGCELFQLPAYLTGGNIMVDGQGIAFSTEQMVDENLGLMTPSAFFDLTEEYCGISQYHIVNNIENYGIQHIDCAAKLLDEETVLIKQLPPGHPETERIEELVFFFNSIYNCYHRPYNVYRVYCGSYDGDEVAAYTNSLILNHKVLVPLFGIDSDEEALIVYQEAMPGYEIVGFPYTDWYYYDALHCRVRAIFDRFMLSMFHRPLDEETIESDQYQITVIIDDRSETGLIESELKLNWKTGSADIWNEQVLTRIADSDSFFANIPWHSPGTQIDYYFQAADYSGRNETLPRTAPAAYYFFEIIPGSGQQQELIPSALTDFKIFPNPFSSEKSGRADKITFRYYSSELGSPYLSIYNLKGQLMESISGDRQQGWQEIHWSPDIKRSGIYLGRLKINGHETVKKIIVMD